jgi:alkaline phosphatase D
MTYHTRIFLVVATLLSSLVACSVQHASTRPPSQVRIGFGSCINDPDSSIWNTIVAQHLDAFLLLGDNVYQTESDFGNEIRITALYDKLFSHPGFKKLRLQTPLYAIWDDHDFGPNNSDSLYNDGGVSKRVFDRYFSPRIEVAELANSVAQEITVQGLQILLLDDRSFRTPANSAGAQMYGSAQIDWVEKRLRSPKSPVVVLASGSQWLNSGEASIKGVESLTQYPDEHRRLIAAIDASPADIVLLSGDRHFAEILEMPLGSKIVAEVTSSPLSARIAAPEFTAHEPLRKSLAIGRTNFGVLTVTLASPCPRMRGEILDSEGMPLAGLSFTSQSDSNSCRFKHTPSSPTS